MFGIIVVRHEKYPNMFYIDTRCYATPDIKIELHIMYYRRRYFFVFVFGNFSFLKSRTQTLLEGFSQLGNQKPKFWFKAFCALQRTGGVLKRTGLAVFVCSLCLVCKVIFTNVTFVSEIFLQKCSDYPANSASESIRKSARQLIYMPWQYIPLQAELPNTVIPNPQPSS